MARLMASVAVASADSLALHVVRGSRVLRQPRAVHNLHGIAKSLKSLALQFPILVVMRQWVRGMARRRLGGAGQWPSPGTGRAGTPYPLGGARRRHCICPSSPQPKICKNLKIKCGKNSFAGD